MKTAEVERKWIPRLEAAARFSMSVETFDKYRFAGAFKTRKVGRMVLCEVASLDEWFENGLEDAAS